jgi:hypothetical protein
MFNLHCVAAALVPVFDPAASKALSTIHPALPALARRHDGPQNRIVPFGEWISAQWPNATGQRTLDRKVCPLFVDTRLQEYTTGTPHERTDRLFLVQRAFLLNDALPAENAPLKRAPIRTPRAGSGSAEAGCSSTNRPRDPSPSSTCPSSIPSIEDKLVSGLRRLLRGIGKPQEALRDSRLGRSRKPILRKDTGEPVGTDDPDSECPPAIWERTSMRVTFQPDDKQKLVFSIRSRTVDVVNDAEETEEYFEPQAAEKSRVETRASPRPGPSREACSSTNGKRTASAVPQPANENAGFSP